jgi:hypothetical protein
LFFERIRGKWEKFKAETAGGKGFRLRQPSKVCILPARHSQAAAEALAKEEGLAAAAAPFPSHSRGRKRQNSPEDLTPL